MNGAQRTAKQTLETRQENIEAFDDPGTDMTFGPAKAGLFPRAPRHLFRAWGEITERICKAEVCTLLLDFDGTLVKIQRRPWEVRVPRRTKLILNRLAREPKLFVAIVSGRRRKDLQTRIGVEALHIIGLHGAEIEGRKAKISKDSRKILALAKRRARKQIASMRGMRIEDKGLSFAVHYRGAKASVARAAKSRLLEVIAPLQRYLKIFEGAMVWEVLPNGIQGKGAAARELLSEFPKGTPAIYIGDDKTDESAFCTLNDQITIRVGKSKETNAKYYLRNTGEVIAFLFRLEAQLLGSQTNSPKNGSPILVGQHGSHVVPSDVNS
jgi:trehalose 6-phosphate phosphatase